MNPDAVWGWATILSGFLLSKYCPEPSPLSAAVQEQHPLALAGQAAMPEAYAHAHYLWYAYSLVGLISLVALLIFIGVTNHLDAKKEAAAA